MITRLTIPYMTTIHATRAIETALAMVPGISHYEIVRGTATIVHDGRATADALRDAVAVAGFDIAELVEDARRLH